MINHQISDAQLMKLIRRKVKLALPYAGAFLKKDDRFATFVIFSLGHVLIGYVAIATRMK